MFKKVIASFIVLIFSFSLSAQLVINEVSQGTGGSDPDEYVELLVVGTRTCTDSCVNLQNWILDDNNGFFGTSGIAGGHIKFNSSAQWACVPYGTIIVIYNAANIYSGIVADETDANNDNVYFLPSNSSYFQGNLTVPTGGTVSATYAGAVYSASGSVWSVLGMQNANDVFQTVSPTNLTAGYFSVGWGSCSGMNIAFTGSASGLLFQNENLISNNPFTQGNWASKTVSFGSPGLGNNAANIAWINAMSSPVVTYFDTITETICDTDSFLFGGVYYNTLGIYTDTVACDTILTLNLTVEVCSECSMDLGSDTLICGTINLTLNPGLFDQYLWQNGSTNSTFNVITPGQYWCKGSNFDTTNLVVNSGFESGNVNFSTNYVPGTAGGTWGYLTNAGTYAVSTSPSAVHNNFFTCSDHTPTGPGNMMIVNGSNVANQSVWCQTITVSPNTDYYFSIWAMSVENTDAANVSSLFFKINGVQIGTNFSPPFSACSWQQYSQTWNSGSNTTANLCVFNHTIVGNNDFAIDDIFFGEVCIVSDTINIASLPATIINDSVKVCFNETATIFGQIQSVAGIYSDTLVSILGCDSIYHNTRLFVGDSLFSNRDTAICAGQTIFLANAIQNTSGLYIDTLLSSTSCDSLLFTNLTVSAAPLADTVITCTNIASQAQVGIDTLYNVLGCDSFYAYTTIKYIAPTTLILIDSCTNIASVAVNFTDTLFTSLGCDSVYQRSTIRFIDRDTSFLTNICTNNLAQATINYTNTLSVHGCDSFTVAQRVVYIEPDTTYLPEINICFGESETIFGISRSQSGMYVSNTSSAGGCDSVTMYQSLVVHALPNVFAGQDTTIDAGSNALLNASGANTYTWNTGSMGSVLDVSPSETTIYTVIGVDGNNCQESDSVTVFVLQNNVELFVPTGFSPNGDGLNDLFRIIDENKFENISLKIYNRWGELVFINTVNNAAWDGKYKNVDQPIENYIYYIQATAKKNQQKFNVSGSISLIR